MSEKKDKTFEEELVRLEEIVAEMEAGQLPLEQLMKSFSEGVELRKRCTAKLSEVEQRVAVLLKKDGQLVEEPFSAAEKAE